MKNQILVLDEDTYELRRLREILTCEGYNIITANDKETALELHIKFSYVLGKTVTLGFNSVNKKRNLVNSDLIN